jgi:hypothetical protein
MPDFDEIMKMAQNAQAGLMKAQEGLDKIEVEGLSGGGLVKIRATAKGRIVAVDIDESRGPSRRRAQRRPDEGGPGGPDRDVEDDRRPPAPARIQDALLAVAPAKAGPPRVKSAGVLNPLGCQPSLA